MMTFSPIDNMDEMEVNHKNKIRSHNWLDNLEWMTHAENMAYISVPWVEPFEDCPF